MEKMQTWLHGPQIKLQSMSAVIEIVYLKKEKEKERKKKQKKQNKTKQTKKKTLYQEATNIKVC